MNGKVLLLLCAITLAQAVQPKLTLSGKVCHCNPEEATTVCSQNGSDNELIVHENCNQFYKCSGSSSIAYYCPGILLYNPLAEICDWPDNVQCGSRPIVPNPDAENGGWSPEEDNNVSGGPDDNNVGTCNCNPGEAPTICAALGSNGVLVAHEHCNQFYQCNHGIPVVLNCNTGLLYNPYTEQCDWPYNVECGDRPVVEIESGNNNESDEDCDENSDSGNGNGDNENGLICNCNPEEAHAICTGSGSNGFLIAHQNCNQFYMCDNGVPVAFYCTSTLLYNPYTERCDWPQSVKCGDRLIPEIECDEDGENVSSGNGDNSNNVESCECNPEQAPTICSLSGSEGTFTAHENCNQFYKCDHGIPIVQNCTSGLLFNPCINQCDWAANVDCGDRPIIEIEGDGNNNNNNGNGESEEDISSGNGDNGNNNGTCNCNPEQAPTICGSAGSDGTLVAHGNCNQFYKCDHGVPVVQNCNSGLLYNPLTEQCDWPDNVDCGDRPIIDIESGGNNNGNGETEEDVSSGNGDNSNNNGTCNCNPEQAPTICGSAGSDGTLVAHENCNQFYKCDHGIPVVQNCNSGLLYNPYPEQCDWPDNVDCGDRPIIDIESGGNNNGNGETEEDVSSGNGDNGNNNGTCNCNPEQAPTICGSAGSDGTLVAHENCNQFYKCDHGVPVVQNCNSGLLYNPLTEQCDWPDNVNCADRPIIDIESGGNNNGNGESEEDVSSGNGDNSNNNGTCNCNPEQAPTICGSAGSDGTLVAHENCNQFYKCDHGVPVVQNCNSGLLYNPLTEQCDWPDNVDCGDRPIIDIESGGNNNGNGESEEDISSGNGDNGNNNGTCNCNPEQAPAICGSAGSDGTLIAHENCNQFYKCDHGVPVVLNCNSGLLYNPVTEQCDWPDNVDCGDRPIIDIESGGNNNGNGETEEDVSSGNGDNGNNNATCNCNPEQAPTICGSAGSDGTLVAHENCNQFYKCDHGVPVVQNCNSGLLYNPYTEQCDWPDNVDCGDRPTIDIESGGNNNGNGGSEEDVSSGNGDNGNNNGTCNCNPEQAPTICGSAGSDGTLVAHENCNQFYKCDHGVPVVQNCNSGLLYNPVTEQCDWPDHVDCGDRPIIDIESGGNNNGNGETEEDVSSGNGDNGNNNATCNCNPEQAPTICGSAGSDGTLVAHENCNQFYKCDHGVPVVQNCNSGLLYNPYTEQCDWPDNVDCGDRPTIDIESGGNNNGNGGSEEDVSSGNGDNGNNNGTCNCNPEQAPTICGSAGSDGTLVAHENCNQFYKCDHGVPVVQNCNSGLLYNPYTEQCDWADNVDCGDRPTIDIESGGNNNGNGGSEEDVSSGNGDNGNNNGTCNCNPEQAPTICGSAGSDGTLVAHENCNQFYICDHGVPVVLNCNSGLLYNPYTEQCDWADKVDCGDRPITEIEGDGNNESEESSAGSGSGNGDTGSGGGSGDNGNGGICNCNPEEAPGICSSGGSDGILIAHQNCNQFYKCDNGVPTVLNCSSNLLYNPYTAACDWPASVDCGNRPIIEIDGDGDNSSDEECEDTGNGDNNGTCNCNPDQAPTICGMAGSDGTFVAHENCNQFYICNHGLPVVVNCSSGLMYNPYITRCDWAYNVDCGDKPIIEIESDNNNEIDENSNESENDNGGSDGGDNGATCNCNPEEAPSICAAAGSNGVYVAHQHCNQFYRCDHGVPVVFNCTTNLMYNPYIERCDWSYNVDCGDRPIIEIESNGNGDNGASGGHGDPSEAATICENDSTNSVLVAHENCDQYYVCSNGKPIAQSCTPNLLYNPITGQCDWSANVECGDRIIPESGDNRPCACNAREAPSICSKTGSYGKLIAHENCNQFYICIDGTPKSSSCPQGRLYDPYTEKCLWAASVNCGERINTSYAAFNKHLNTRRNVIKY